MNLLAKTSLRYLPRHPWQLAVALLGIALGVAVIVAVDLANSSAQRAFLGAVDAVYGEASHQVVGGPAGIPESDYVRLRLDGGVRASAPVVEGFVSIGGRAFNLLGVDPFAEAGFRAYRIGRGGQGRAWLDLVSRPGAFVLDERAAAALGLDVGDSAEVIVAGKKQPGFLAATLAAEGGRPGLSDVVISDISTAQEWLGLNGRLSRIDLRIEDDAGAARIAEGLPEGSQLLSAAGRSRQTLGMTRSFSTSLTAMSLLAVLVGVFLIYNSVSFTVIQRRPLLGVMRSLGVTRAEIAGLVLAEALVLGMVGVVAGLGLGYLLSRELLGLVTQSINDHYYYVGAASVHLAPWSVVKGIVAGVGASLLAAALPAWEATQAPPRQTLARASLEQRVSEKLGLIEICAIAAIAGGILALIVTDRSLVVGFAGMFLIVVGLALLVPGFVAFLSSRLAGPIGRLAGLSTRMAIQGIGRSLSRTGVAVTALAVAVAATIGVDVMVGSFRGSVDAWLQRSLNADMYVAPPRLAGGRAEREIDPLLLRRIVALPEVDHVGYSRSVDVVTSAGVRRLLAVDMTDEYRANTRLTRGDATAAWAGFDDGSAVLISEPLAFLHNLDVGDEILLPTARGVRGFRIAGVYEDFDTGSGTVMLNRDLYRQWWQDDSVTAIAVYLEDPAEAQAFEAAVDALSAGRQSLLVTSNRDILKMSLDIFDRTFTITNVLYLLTVAVAFVGMVGAFSALQMERIRELGTLRALGFTPWQVGGLVNVQTLGLGLLSGLAALPLGVVMAWILLHVINRRAFGWQIDMSVSPSALLGALALAVAAATLAGIYPSWRMARTAPASAMREE